MANTYVAGSVVRLATAYTVSGTATDPTTVTLYIKPPLGALLTYVYGSSSIVKDSTGNYHFDYTTVNSGSHYYRWTGAGTVVAANENQFTCTSNFV